MSAEIHEIPLEQIHLYGVKQENTVHLCSFSLKDPSKRQEFIDDLFNQLAQSITQGEWVILGSTMFSAEDFSVFKVM